jgi:hypothetical protein
MLACPSVAYCERNNAVIILYSKNLTNEPFVELTQRTVVLNLAIFLFLEKKRGQTTSLFTIIISSTCG